MGALFQINAFRKSLSHLNRPIAPTGKWPPNQRDILSLTLADLGGVGERILHAVPDTAGNFDAVSARPGHESNLMAPYFAAHGGDCIAEGEECFWIPGGGSRHELS